MSDREPECYDLPDATIAYLGEFGWCMEGVRRPDGRDTLPPEVFARLEGGVLDECGYIQTYRGRLAALDALRHALQSVAGPKP